MLRPALSPPPANPLEGCQLIEFRHPAYPDPEQALLLLEGVDGGDTPGLEYETALLACGVVTGNTWPDGWLATKNQAGVFVAIDRPEDSILREGTYYYFVGKHEPDYKYPVVPSFDHWRFPHRNLPQIWQQITVPPYRSTPSIKRDIVSTRDMTCRISGYSDALEMAHFVPRSDGHWFNSNKMASYGSWDPRMPPMEDPSNIMLLRQDLHHLFDQRRFTLVPKRTRENETPKLSIHLLASGLSTELGQLYHNRVLQPLRGIAVPFLFARFAWSIFADQTLPFFKGTAKYAVSIFDVDSGQSETKEMWEPQVRSIARIFGKYSSTGSVSPKKRSRSQRDAQDGCVTCSEDEGDDDDSEVEAYDDPPRGRPRKRSWDWIQEESPPGLSQSFTSTRSAESLMAGSDGIEVPVEDKGAALQGGLDGVHKSEPLCERPTKRRV